MARKPVKKKTRRKKAVPLKSASPVKLEDARRAFQAWLAVPREWREPKTQLALARHLGVNKDTLTQWKKDPDFWVGLRAFQGAYWMARLPEVVDALVSHTKKGERWAADLFLKGAGILTGDGGGQSLVNLNLNTQPHGGLDGLSPDALAAIQDGLLRKMGVVPMAADLVAPLEEGRGPH